MSNTKNMTPEQKRELLAQLMAKKQAAAALMQGRIAKGGDKLAFPAEGLTYAQLQEQSQKLANRLHQAGSAKGSIIAIARPLGPSAATAVIATLMTGASFIYLDPKAPAAYASQLLTSTGTRLLIASSDLADWAPAGCSHVDPEQIADAPTFKVQVEADDDALILEDANSFVRLSHKAISSRYDGLAKELEINGESKVAATHMTALLLGLSQNAQLVTDLAQADFIWTHAGEADALTNLKPQKMLFSGEAISRDLALDLERRSEAAIYFAASFAQAAGPISLYKLQDGRSDLLPAGQPLGTTIHILDRNLKPAPHGAKGTLYIGGSSLASGTIGSDQNDLFMDNPFQKGQKLYNTRRNARRLADGSLEVFEFQTSHAMHHLSCIDLEAIEARIADQHGVVEAGLIARHDGKRQRLIAHLVLRGRAEVDQLDLQGFLPPHLCPDACVRANHLPKTAEGKLDHEALANAETLDSGLPALAAEQLLAHNDITEAAALIREPELEEATLHLSDIIPNWSGLAAQEKSDISAEEDHLQDEDAPMALSKGPDFQLDPDMPKSLSQALIRSAQTFPEHGVRVITAADEEAFIPYPELLERATRILGALQAQGSKPGDTAVLQIRDLRDYFPVLWACVLGGITPVTVAIAPNYTEENAIVAKLYNVWRLIKNPVVICSDDIAEDMANLPSFMPMEGIVVQPLGKLLANEQPGTIYEAKGTDLAFFQLSSGSTGISKCIQETHTGIITHIQSSAQVVGYNHEDMVLNWLSMDHVVPLLMYHMKDVYLGCDQIQVVPQVILSEPLLWLDLIEKHRVTHTWSPNFAYKLLADNLIKANERSWDLSSIKYFLNAGEQVTLPVCREFLKLAAPFGVREDAMQPAYGMAEVCTAIVYESPFSLTDSIHFVKKESLGGRLRFTTADDENGLSFVVQGPPIPGTTMRVVDAKGTLLPECVIGRIQITCPSVSPGYLKNPEANEEAFIGDNWYNTGDLGYLKDSKVVITGREKELIIINGANYYCYDIEDLVYGIDGVLPTFVAACGIDDPATGTEGLAIFFSPQNEDLTQSVDIIAAIRKRVTWNLGISPSHIVPIPKDRFPKTTSGKLQRTKMKNNLLAGEYRDVLRELDLIQKNENTVPDWFFQKTWIADNHHSPLKPANLGRVFLFETFKSSLPAYLRKQGVNCTLITPGTVFGRKGEDHYEVSFMQEESYGELFEELGGLPDRIIVNSPDADLMATLIFAKAIIANRKNNERPILFFIGKESQYLGNDFVNATSGAIHGFLPTLAIEQPWLRVRHVDVDKDNPADQIYHELCHGGTPAQVAWRRGKRFTPALEKVDITTMPLQESPIRRGGHYLLAGGLGGIGIELTRYLCLNYQAKILILGRSELKDQKAQIFAELQRLPGDVRYAAVDLSSMGMEEAVVEAEDHWGHKLDAIFQLAGAFIEKPITEETIGSIIKNTKAKTYGSQSLDRLLDSRPDTSFIAFGSTNGYFGGSNCAAYAAACAFQERHFYSHINRDRIYCFNWSMWDDVGMSQGYGMKTLTLANGYHILSIRQGINSMMALLNRKGSNLYIGLNGGNPILRRHTADSHLQQLQVFYATRGHQGLTDTRILNINDRLGNPVRASFHHVEGLPHDSQGQVDLKRLAAMAQGPVSTDTFKEAQTETETAISKVWCDVLGLDRISVDANFFELGGHSLMATTVIGRISRLFNIELNVRVLFEATTIETLAEHVDSQKGEGDAVAPLQALPRDGDGLPQPAPLSFAQQRLWFLYQLEGASATYNIAGALELQGQLDAKALQDAINTVIDRHESLRTTFHQGENGPVQKVSKQLQIKLGQEDLTHLEAQAQEDAVREQAREHAALHFNLESGPLLDAFLLKLGDARHVLLINQHHIISDGWSFGVWVREIATLYAAYAEQRPNPLPLPKLHYPDFAAWQRDWLQGEVLERQLRYWKRHLNTLPPLLEVPTDKSRPSVFTYKGAISHFKLPMPLTKDLNALARHEGTTLFNVLLTAFKVLLHRYTGSEDIFVGSPIANRTRTELEDMIGIFMNNLTLRTHLGTNDSYLTALGHVKQTTTEAYAHQDLPFEQLVDAIDPERSLSHTPLFQVMFVLQNAPMDQLQLPGLTLKHLPLQSQISKYDLNMLLDEGPNGLTGMFEYCTDLFEENTIQRMTQHFQNLLEAIVAAPQTPIGKLAMLGRDERHAILDTWNDTAQELPNQQLLHAPFMAQAQATPDAIAVIADGSGAITYAALHQRAQALGSHLRQIGARPNTLVAVVEGKGIEQVVAVLGVLYAGAAYLPIDPHWPQERRWQLLQLGQAQIAVTHSSTDEHLQWPQGFTVVHSDAATDSSVALDMVQSPDDLAYVIFTSGSTGTPKGVAMQHSATLNTVLDINQRFRVSASDRVFGLSALSFDLSVYDLFGLLGVGGTLVLPSQDHIMSPTRWAEAIREHGVTIWNTVPALMQVLVDTLQGQDATMEGLRLALLSGDWIPVSLPARMDATFPGIEKISLGGATEAAIWSIFYPIDSVDADAPSVPYGYPLANQAFYVLNDHLQPCPLGVTGNLYIGGVGLAREYWANPERTDASFITHQGKRLYKTGDLGRYLPNGDGGIGPIQFLGRADFQVKLNGYRIELGEIEFVLREHEAITEAVVDIVGTGTDRSLAAWLITGNKPEDKELRQWVAARLPEYMVPATFTAMDELPLTANGKVNRKALPTPEAQIISSVEPIAPSTPTQKSLAAICAEVLGRESVGINESFFELGGNSLAAIQFITAVRNQLQVELSVRALFESPTIEGVAIRVDTLLDAQNALEASDDDDLEEMEF